MLQELFDIAGKVIVVTGAGNGIGSGIALGLASLGAQVHAWDISQVGLDQVQASAKDAGKELTTSIVDVGSEAQVCSAMKRVVELCGRVDVVFVNAGIAGKAGPVDEYSLEDWQRVHAVNLDGAFLVAREAARYMKQKQSGKIVFTSSVWGERGVRSAPVTAYMSSKGAIINLTRQLAVELAQFNINVNSIAPSGFKTTLGAGELDESLGAWLTARIPMGRMVEPSEMVGPAAFLASRASDWVTGVNLPVDGGYLAE